MRSLYDWLRRETELRGCRLRVESAASNDEQAMGAPLEIVLAVTAAVAPVLVRVLPVWFQNRHSDVEVTITNAQGRVVSLSGKRLANPEEVVNRVLEISRTEIEDRSGDRGDAATS
ncbi:hypothetical protein Daura_50235 [Dactylosporangium aurantiacum]|uniref:Uncharacterized protein n=1 Tax=Dactylosporangium aurantiacum TaxID=35754 RepID=A0A9Q9MM86_9ACTN|nr:hypothetical protein [Dactylosporangium aurantiacum]MDG6107344.1 hypothetical protein [Dactylosporangium aurantiacum]UWZ54522.1 hypothetical protein Daura_50235 [Dactylosporangium aurantiacum]